MLDWNTPAIDFYSDSAPAGMDEWTTHRVTGDALVPLARQTTGP